MHIVVITGGYPSAALPSHGAFVRQFVRALAQHGENCTVINPVSIFARRHGRLPPLREVDVVGDKVITVLRPRMMSFSMRQIGSFNTGMLTQQCFDLAVRWAVRSLPDKPSLYYGHFLYPAGYAAVEQARRHRVPGVVAVGEGTFWTVASVGFPRARQHMRHASGFLAVSSPIAEGLRTELDIPASKIRVFPNGVDRAKFYPRDRGEMCRHLGLSEDTFNISFVGTFDDLKGGARLVEAVRGMENVRLIMLGHGSAPMPTPQLLFRGTVEHTRVPEYLCASDLFVLPTSEEGSCNAVIEALACGLPIITSTGRYMDDIVDDRAVLRVDPLSVAEIRSAIATLMGDTDRRRTMAAAALELASKLDICERARGVAAWLATLQRGDRP